VQQTVGANGKSIAQDAPQHSIAPILHRSQSIAVLDPLHSIRQAVREEARR
jgi:hypothetical protein